MYHMMGRLQRETVFLVLCCVCLQVLAQQCHVTPKCTCQFDGDHVPVEEQSGGTEALAGAVGALSSLVVSGGGFGVWYLLKGKKSSTDDDDSFSRSNSDLSDESVTGGRKGGKSPPPVYKDPNLDNNGPKANNNIYHVPKKDDVNAW